MAQSFSVPPSTNSVTRYWRSSTRRRVHRDDVRMIERRSHLRLALKTAAGGGVGQVIRQELDRHGSVERGIRRPVHRAHAALAHKGNNFVRAKFVACGKRHTSDTAKFSRLQGVLCLDPYPEVGPPLHCSGRGDFVFSSLGQKLAIFLFTSELPISVNIAPDGANFRTARLSFPIGCTAILTGIKS